MNIYEKSAVRLVIATAAAVKVQLYDCETIQRKSLRSLLESLQDEADLCNRV
jgi:hypothetical protein